MFLWCVSNRWRLTALSQVLQTTAFSPTYRMKHHILRSKEESKMGWRMRI
jgi:hypothetical protein